MRRTLLYVAVLLVTCCLDSLAVAEIVSLYPVSDRSADDRPNVITGALYDGLYDVFVDAEGSDAYLRTYNHRAMWETRSALEFDLNSIPADARIVSATVFLQSTGLASAGSPPTRLLVEGYSGDGMVRLPDLSALNAVGFADLSASDELPSFTVDATPFIQSLSDVGSTHAGFTLRTVPGATVYLASNEWFQPASRPRLEISYETVAVPEPWTLLMAFAASVALALSSFAGRHRLIKIFGIPVSATKTYSVGRKSICAAALLVTCAFNSVAVGELVSLYPVSDRSADDRPNVDTGALYDGLYDSFFEDSDPDLGTFHFGGIRETRAALEFDVASLPRDARIMSATLALQATGLAQAEVFPTHLLVDGYSGNGVVELADFSASNPIGFADLPVAGQLPALSIDATSFLRSLHELGGASAGFTLRTVPGATVHVASNEWFQPASRPRLEISYETVAVPEPWTLQMAFIASVTLAIWLNVRQWEACTSPVRKAHLG